MTTLLATARYLFWKTIYLFRPSPKSLEAAMLEIERTWPPWRTFQPYLYRNDTGHMWEIYLKDHREYVATREITAEVGFSLDTGQVTSIQIFDEELQRLAKEPSAPKATVREDHVQTPQSQ